MQPITIDRRYAKVRKEPSDTVPSDRHRTGLLPPLARHILRLSVGLAVTLTFSRHFGEPSPFEGNDQHDLPAGFRAGEACQSLALLGFP